MKKFIVIIALTMSFNAMSWDGVDSESGADVEIGRGNLVREGEEIEFYDYSSGEYRYGEVQDMERNGSGVDVEVLDNETGEVRTFEME